MGIIEKISWCFRPGKTMPVYCRFSYRLGKYIAFQIIKPLEEEPEPKRIGIVFFDWLGDAEITSAELRGLHTWGKMKFYDPPIPRGGIHVFDAVPPKLKASLYRCFAFWYNWDSMFAFHKLWGHLPEARRMGAKEYQKANGTLDLRGGHTSVTIKDSALNDVLVDGDISSLSINNSTVKGTICDPLRGAKLHLSLRGKRLLYPGLERLGCLLIETADEIDLHALAETYPALRSLSVYGKPGTIRRFDALRRFSHLEVFHCFNMFGFDGSDMPGSGDLSCVFELRFDGLPDDAAKTIRKKWKCADDVIVSITNAHAPEWFIKNRDNPFREWGNREELTPKIIKQAKSFYQSAKCCIANLEAISDANHRQAAFVDIIHEFVRSFNVLDAKKSFIETMEREEIYEAGLLLLKLAREKAGIVMDDDGFSVLFDEHREW